MSSWTEWTNDSVTVRRFAESRAAFEADGGKVYRSADELWADKPDTCRICHQPREAPGTYYGWSMWLTCGRWRGECVHGCRCHDDEGPIIGIG